jgi:hypothetical protein
MMADEPPVFVKEFTPAPIPPPPVPFPDANRFTSTQGCPSSVAIVATILLISAGVNAIILLVQALALAAGGSTLHHARGIIVYLCLHHLLATVLSTVSGVGLLRMATWARKGAITTIITLFALSTYAFCIAISTSFSSQAQERSSSPSLVAGIIAATVLLLAVGINGGMLYGLMRPDVVTAFREKGEKA